MSWFSKWAHKLWTGYSDEDLAYTERKLIHKWGSVDPREVTFSDVPVSTNPGDTIHSVSIGAQVPFCALPWSRVGSRSSSFLVSVPLELSTTN